MRYNSHLLLTISESLTLALTLSLTLTLNPILTSTLKSLQQPFQVVGGHLKSLPKNPPNLIEERVPKYLFRQKLVCVSKCVFDCVFEVHQDFPDTDVQMKAGMLSGLELWWRSRFEEECLQIDMFDCVCVRACVSWRCGRR